MLNVPLEHPWKRVIGREEGVNVQAHRDSKDSRSRLGPSAT